MKITDEIVEAVLAERWWPGTGRAPWSMKEKDEVVAILEVYHRVLATREPDDELVERVRRTFEAYLLPVKPGAADDLARAAIKAIWRES